MPQTTSAADGLWLETAPSTDYPTPLGAVEVDVAVIGAGIAGLTTAWFLTRDGARVAVLEAGRIGSGVTSCTTAKASALQATMYSTILGRKGAEAGAVYAQASLAGVQRLAEIVAVEKIDCQLERRSAYTYAAAESERAAVEREHEAAVNAGLSVELVDSPDLPYGTYGAVRLEDQLQFHPVRYLQGVAAGLQRAGCQVFEQVRALGVSEGSPCRVATTAGDVRAEHVVVATHYPFLDRGVYFALLNVQRSYCVAARLASGSPSQGMSISAGRTTRSVRSYGELLIVGGEGHPTGSDKASPERYRRLETFAREHWDVAEITHRWSAHDAVPYDHLPMIGSYRPGSSRLWVATGFMKWGMATATFAAMILADRIAGRRNPWADTFSPQRISLTSAHEIGQLGAKYAAGVLLDRVSPPQAWSGRGIQPGEARVLRDGAGKKGVYCSEDGTLHAVSIGCSHLGCMLRFNAAERSWDCPCHGSRFAVDGSVLEGPAVKPLERRNP
jgi:glycine/D-amino acid oxidase-like deaminating enzyme/nitrite reductase/ring-hydroxylating ferredoxin subunit